MEIAFKAYMRNRLTLALALGVVLFLLALASLDIAAFSQWEITSVPSQPSIVSVSGAQLIVQKRKPDNSLEDPQPYTIKGVNTTGGVECIAARQPR